MEISALTTVSPALRQAADSTPLKPWPGPGSSTILQAILRAKGTFALNGMRTLKKHLVIHFFLFMGLVSLLVVGGSAMFLFMFRFLLQQELIGPPLVDMLMNMVLLAFMMMLIFSNLIITLSTTYISREVDYYMSQPVDHRDVFLFKFVETTIYSSWAFLILSFPLFLGYGLSKELPLTFYLWVILLMMPFVLIPSAIGSMLTMILAATIPARRTRTFMLVVGGSAILGTVAMARALGFGQLIRSATWDDFNQFLQLLEVGRLQLFPNAWLAEGTIAAAKGNTSEVIYWFLVLLSTGLFLSQLCLWLVKPLYYRGWVMARGAASQGHIDPKKSFFNRFDRIYAFLGREYAALVGKDLRTFWRDPAQWSQLVILFGLLYIYVANIRGATTDRQATMFMFHWQTFLSFLNMGATCFIVSIITTRFVYPMLSLEGRQFWVIGLAPIPRRNLIYEKYVFCLIAVLTLTVPLMIFSNLVLGVPDLIFNRSMITLLALSVGLTSLSVGLGAISPNFREDNPARIANGVGGTMNIVLSLLYIGVIIALVSVPTYIELTHGPGSPAWDMVARWQWATWSAFAIINLVVAVVPLWLGIRAWERLEF